MEGLSGWRGVGSVSTQLVPTQQRFTEGLLGVRFLVDILGVGGLVENKMDKVPGPKRGRESSETRYFWIKE